MEVKYRKTNTNWLGTVTINTLEDFLNFRSGLGKGEELVISSDSEEFTIEIYDNYRE